MKELENFPWSFDDIYLKDATQQIRAVCSNANIAEALAETVNEKTGLTHQDQKLCNFIQSAYILQVMMGKAKIEVKDINTMFLEKAYMDFSQKLDEIIKFFNIEVKNKIEEMTVIKDGKEMTNVNDN